MKDKVYNYFKNHSISIYSIVDHKAVFTMEEADSLDISLDGEDCKNLFLKCKKEKRYFLITLKPDKKLDLKGLTTKLGVKKLTFASEDELKDILGLTIGSVSPMGLLNDIEGRCEFFLDEDYKKSRKLCFHPNINTATITLEMKHFIKFLKTLNRELKWVKL